MSGRDRSFLPYLTLRGLTAVGTLLAGFSQTFVFARTLDPERFSLFIVIGNLGLSLWLFDLGIAKVLFVNMRAQFLSDRLRDSSLPLQAASIAFLYAVLVLAGAVACFVATEIRYVGPISHNLEYSFFFIYAALNLVWFVLRNISVATDKYLYFETLEAIRRAGHLALIFSLLLPIPFMLFLLLSNALWAVLLIVMVGKLTALGSVRLELAGMPRALWVFFREHRRALLGSGSYAAGEMYMYNFPSVLVPILYGLGAPTIVFDTAFKIFRGATVLFSAMSDLIVPRQTRAFVAGDRQALVRATWIALGLGLIPALAVNIILVAVGTQLYHLLLGHSAVMPPSFTPILVVMVFCNLVQTVSNFLLVHTGFFSQIARLALSMVGVMTVVAIAAVVLHLSIIQFAALYAVAYLASASLYAMLAIRFPLKVKRAVPAS